MHWNQLGELVQIVGPHPMVSDSVSLELGLRMCILNKFLSDLRLLAQGLHFESYRVIV